MREPHGEMVVGEPLELRQFVCGGYVLTAPVARPAYTSAELLPEQLVTSSFCIAESVPDIWALRWASVDGETRRLEAAKCGIASGRLEAVIEHVTAAHQAGEFLWPNLFLSVELARRFWREFLAHRLGLFIVGIGLHKELAAEFLDAAKPGHHETPPGVWACVARGTPIAAGGKPLGWEILGYAGGGDFHSWLCNGLETVALDELGIRPGTNGLIESYADAEAVARYCRQEGARAEPVPWHPWLLVRHETDQTG